MCDSQPSFQCLYMSEWTRKSENACAGFNSMNALAMPELFASNVASRVLHFCNELKRLHDVSAKEASLSKKDLSLQ